MINWLKARMTERSTIMGLIAIFLAGSLLVIPLVVEGDPALQLSENVKWLIGALFAAGLGGVLFPEKRQ